jgi:N-acetylmuramoyl-L-alanine amidase
VPGLGGDGRGRLECFPAWVFCLLAIVLAGCATGPSEDQTQAPNWQREEVVTAPMTPVAPVTPPAPAPVAVPAAPAAPTNQPAETWISLSRWCKANGLAAPCLVGQAPTPAYALSTTGGVCVLRVGSLVAHWDGLEVRLGFAPQMMNGQPYVHTLDLKKTLEPMVGGARLGCLKTNPTIVIDPGHGGQDSGTTSVLGYRYEKEFTLDWARRLGSLLATNGWQVFLTRNYDMDLSVANRIVFAEAHKADIFLSLHFNSSAPNDQQVGLETYCLTPTGLPSTITRGYSDNSALTFPNNAFDAQNLRLALQVHRALLQVNGRHDRGLRRARYLGVLRGQNRPAILVEGGYLSNPHEASLIADPAYRQRLAEAVAQALTIKSDVQSPKSEVGSREPADRRVPVRADLSESLHQTPSP